MSKRYHFIDRDLLIAAAILHDIAKIYELSPMPSKPIIDQIDTILAQHYGFTEEELDYIINYDIKYRMGLVGGQTDED